MSFSVVKPVLTMGRTHRYMQRLAFGEGVLAGVLMIVLFHPKLWSPWLSVASAFLFLYAARKGYVFFRMRRAARLTQREQQFLQQHLDAAHLRQCLYRQDHFWRESLILRGLRTILQHSLPQRLASARKRKRLRHQFQHTLRPLRLMRFNVDWIGYGGALATAIVLLPSSLHLALIGITMVVAVLEIGQSVLQWRLRRQEETVVDTLCQWTLEQNFRVALRAIPHDGYTHYPLYQARSWFEQAKPEERETQKEANGDIRKA